MRVETLSDHKLLLHHERCSIPMEVWSSPLVRAGGRWFWNLQGSRVLGEDANMVVAIEKAMTDLERMVLGVPTA